MNISEAILDLSHEGHLASVNDESLGSHRLDAQINGDVSNGEHEDKNQSVSMHGMKSGTSRGLIRDKNLQKMHKLVIRLSQVDSGVIAMDRQANNMKYYQSIVAKDMVDWILRNCHTFDRVEAIYLAKEIVKEGFAVLVEGQTELDDSDECFLYWQKPCFWPTSSEVFTSGDYAIYLLKRSMRDSKKHALNSDEKLELKHLKQTYGSKWTTFESQARHQVQDTKWMSQDEKRCRDVQEKAFWNRIKSAKTQLKPIVNIRSEHTNQSKIRVSIGIENDIVPEPNSDLSGETLALFWEQYVSACASVLNRSRIKASIASKRDLNRKGTYPCFSLIVRCESLKYYDPFLSKIEATNPWLLDDKSAWFDANSRRFSMSDLPPQQEDIHRWSLSFAELIADPKGLVWFRKFLQQEFSEENLNFYLACEDMKKAPSCIEFYNRAKNIFETFILPGSQMEVNIASAMRQPIIKKMTKKIEVIQERELMENQKLLAPKKEEVKVKSALSQLLEEIENEKRSETRAFQESYQSDDDEDNGSFDQISRVQSQQGGEYFQREFETISIAQREQPVDLLSIMSKDSQNVIQFQNFRQDQEDSYSEDFLPKNSTTPNFSSKHQFLIPSHKIPFKDRSSISSLPSLPPPVKLEAREDYCSGTNVKTSSSSKHLQEMIQQLDEEAVKGNLPSPRASISLPHISLNKKPSKSTLTAIQQQITNVKKATRSHHKRELSNDVSSLSERSSFSSVAVPDSSLMTLERLGSSQLAGLNAPPATDHSIGHSIQRNFSFMDSSIADGNIVEDSSFGKHRRGSTYSSFEHYLLEEDVYDTAQSHVRDLMTRDSYPRFIASFLLKSSEWQPPSSLTASF